MFDKRERVKSILQDAVVEMEFLIKMSQDIRQPDDYITSMTGLVLFRACSMSLQYITEGFVKIRNLCSLAFFAPYKTIPWKSVFGMRNFLSHEYGDVDAEGVFNTVKSNIPDLLRVARTMQEDLESGQLDRFL